MTKYERAPTGIILHGESGALFPMNDEALAASITDDAPFVTADVGSQLRNLTPNLPRDVLPLGYDRSPAVGIGSQLQTVTRARACRGALL